MSPRKCLHFPNIFQIRSFEVQPSLKHSHKFPQPNPTMDMMRSNHREHIFFTKKNQDMGIDKTKYTYGDNRPEYLKLRLSQKTCNIWSLQE